MAVEGCRMESTANYYFDHPKGVIYGWFSDAGLQWLQLPHGDTPERMNVLHSAANDGRGRALGQALERYFAGQCEAFNGVPLDFGEATPFQRETWTAACEVEWGRSATYGDLAESMGRGAGSARAVGRALGANPLPILVPCHRFLAANGDLVNFAAGLDWKRDLLRLEGLSLVE
jgi:O-6-methylguanine DNA methyltransferase